MSRKGLLYSINRDFSDYGLGCILLQTYNDGDRKPIWLLVTLAPPAEINYSGLEIERPCIVWVLKTLLSSLMHEHFVVYTDHATLPWLLTVDDPSARLIRWCLQLAEFHFEVKYKKGRINTQAVALSRLQTSRETIPHDNNDTIPVYFLKLVNVESKFDRHPEGLDLIDMLYVEIYELLATEEEPAAPSTHFKPKPIEELLAAQLKSPFPPTFAAV